MVMPSPKPAKGKSGKEKERRLDVGGRKSNVKNDPSAYSNNLGARPSDSVDVANIQRSVFSLDATTVNWPTSPKPKRASASTIQKAGSRPRSNRSNRSNRSKSSDRSLKSAKCEKSSDASAGADESTRIKRGKRPVPQESDASNSIRMETKKPPVQQKPRQYLVQDNETPSSSTQTLDSQPIQTPPHSPKDYKMQCTPEQANGLRAFAASCQSLTMKKIYDDFMALPKPTTPECQAFHLPHNQVKNRYNDVLCIDATRVILRFGATDHSATYIHANKVDYTTLMMPFIITQGPLSRTVNDFWRMVWQENTTVIIMLCKNIENGKKKCAEYYPTQVNERCEYQPFALTLLDQKVDSGTVISALLIEYAGEKRTVTHYQIPDWPDYSAPTFNAHQMFTLLRNARDGTNPVVHCSAGIGRSGTLVAVEMLFMDWVKGVPLDVMSVVRTLRYCRGFAVQTLDQLLSIYRLMLKFGQLINVLSEADFHSFMEMIDNSH